MHNIVKKLRHCLVIHISGPESERLLNLCRHNGIFLTDLYRDEAGIFATIAYGQFQDLKRLRKKCDADCSVVTESGLVFLLGKYRKHLVFLFCLFVFFGIVFYSSLFIWHIDIQGESVYTKEEMTEYIREYLVPLGTRRSGLDFKEIEKNLRMQFDKAAWITCEANGTRLIVRIVETVEVEDIKTTDSPCNIVAVKDAVVTDLIATSGTKLKNPGDEVKKGDVLITGAVNIYNEYEELIETNYVAADGVVYGQTVCPYSSSFSMEYTSKRPGKAKKTALTLQVGSNVYNLWSPKNSAELERTEQVCRFHIGDSYYLPIALVVEKYYKPDYELCTYTEEEACEKQQNMLNQYISGLQKKGVEILQNNVTIEIKDGMCRAEGNLVVREIIGVPETLTIPDSETEESDL